MTQPDVDRTANARSGPVTRQMEGALAPGAASALEEQRVLAGVLGALFGPEQQAPPVLDRYELEERVGAGGLGVVFAARDPALDRRVAVKLLARADALGQARLLREAKAMASFVHPNVIAVHDVGTYEAGGDAGVFIVMDLIEGQDAQAWLRQRRPWREVVDVFAQAGRGLAAAHAARLVHRDFKPSNVMIGEDGRVCVLDFGIARAINEPDAAQTAERDSEGPTDSPSASELSESMTRTGHVVGTPRYMAPEQHRGEPLDARTDVFAFCASLYAGVYGTSPFAGETFAELEIAKLSGPRSPPPSDVPRWLAAVLLKGMAPRPEHRHASMEAVLGALDRGDRGGRRMAYGAVGATMVAGLVAVGAMVRPTSGPVGEAPALTSADPEFAGILDEARRELEAKRLHRAEELLREAARLRPADPRVHYYLATIGSWLEREPEVVFGDIELALAGDLQPSERAAMEGWAAHLRGDNLEAERRFGSAVEASPDPFSLYGLFEAQFHGGRPEASLSTHQALLEVAPDFSLGVMHVLEYCAVVERAHCVRAHIPLTEQQDAVTPQIWRARLLRLQGRNDQAWAVLTELAAHSDANPWLRGDLLRLALATSRYDETALPEPRRTGLLELAVAYARGDMNDIARAWGSALDAADFAVGTARSPTRGQWASLVAFAWADPELPEDHLDRIGRSFRQFFPEPERWTDGTAAIAAYLAALTGDSARLSALQSHPHPGVAAVAAGVASREDAEASLHHFGRAAVVTTAPRLASLAHFELARAHRRLGDHARVVESCRRVLDIALVPWVWGALAPRCAQWTAEAAQALGRDGEAAAARARLERMRSGHHVDPAALR